MIKAIFAVDEAGGISKNGKMPWPYNKSDMRWFVKHTNHQNVVMGRGTWEAPDMIAPLPNRENIIITREPKRREDGAVEMTLLDLAMYSVLQPDLDFWIIGGKHLIESAWNTIDCVFITRINGEYDCDKFLDMSPLIYNFELVSSTEEEGLTFEIWSRY